MPKYRIHFLDGQTVDKDAENGTVAKVQAKHDRLQALGTAPRTDARVKVARVEELGSGQS